MTGDLFLELVKRCHSTHPGLVVAVVGCRTFGRGTLISSLSPAVLWERLSHEWFIRVERMLGGFMMDCLVRRPNSVAQSWCGRLMMQSGRLAVEEMLKQMAKSASGCRSLQPFGSDGSGVRKNCSRLGRWILETSSVWWWITYSNPAQVCTCGTRSCHRVDSSQEAGW